MIVAVGSTRGPKVEAVRRVLAQLGERASELARAEIVAVDVTAGGTPPMPLSLDELLDGARSRAHLAVEALQTQGHENIASILQAMQITDLRHGANGIWFLL